MSTTLPIDATKANCDAGTDDPKQAILTDLAVLVDKFNALKTALGSLAQMAVGSGLELEVSGGAVADLLRSSMKETALAATTTITAAHRARLLACTTSMTLNLTASGTLGDGWWCAVRNAGIGTVTIDPATTELIDGVAILALAPGESAILCCNGSAFKTVGYSTALTSGAVLQEVDTTDAGSSTTSTTLVNVNAGNVSITPKNAASNLIVDVQFNGRILQLASVNTIGTFQLYDATNAILVGQPNLLESPSGAGGVGCRGALNIKAIVANAVLTARSFQLRANTSDALAAAQAINMVWSIREVKA